MKSDTYHNLVAAAGSFVGLSTSIIKTSLSKTNHSYSVSYSYEELDERKKLFCDSNSKNVHSKLVEFVMVVRLSSYCEEISSYMCKQASSFDFNQLCNAEFKLMVQCHYRLHYTVKHI